MLPAEKAAVCSFGESENGRVLYRWHENSNAYHMLGHSSGISVLKVWARSATSCECEDERNDGRHRKRAVGFVGHRGRGGIRPRSGRIDVEVVVNGEKRVSDLRERAAWCDIS